MRFLVDECTGPAVAQFLRQQKFETFSVYDQARGKDESVIAKAFHENWILIMNDKDFGEYIFKENKPHCGVIFLRLLDERNCDKIGVIEKLLFQYKDKLLDNFVVVTEKKYSFCPKIIIFNETFSKCI